MRSAIVAEARTWLEVRFRHQGRSREGVDCAGLVEEVARSLNLSDVRVTGYARLPDGKSLLKLCREHMIEIDPALMQPGDVCVFRSALEPEHLGIVGDYSAGGSSLIHASAYFGRVIEVRFDSKARQHIVAAFRLPGVD